MNLKVNSGNSVKKAGKKAKTSASKVESLGFASALEQAQAATEVDAAEFVSNVSSVDSVGAVLFDTEEASKGQVPQKAKERGYYILDLLEELEKDILSGNDTKVTEKLEEALKIKALDIEDMPQVVKDLMEEIDMRATLELEKLKS